MTRDSVPKKTFGGKKPGNQTDWEEKGRQKEGEGNALGENRLSGQFEGSKTRTVPHIVRFVGG